MKEEREEELKERSIYGKGIKKRRKASKKSKEKRKGKT